MCTGSKKYKLKNDGPFSHGSITVAYLEIIFMVTSRFIEFSLTLNFQQIKLIEKQTALDLKSSWAATVQIHPKQ